MLESDIGSEEIVGNTRKCQDPMIQMDYIKAFEASNYRTFEPPAS